MARRITNEGKWAEDNSALTAAKINTVLTTVDASNYPATIAGLIDRIGDAHEIIQAKAYEMLLNVLANLGDSIPNSNTRLLKDGSHKIMDTASAVNSIVINASLNKTPEHGTTITINKGYYTSDFTVKSKGTHSAANLSDITADNTLEGTEGWTSDGTRVKGTLTNKSGNLNAGNKSYYTGANSKTYLALTIPATGKYTKDSLLKSDIIYNNTGIEDGIQSGPSWNPQVEITKTTNAETNESGLTINSLTIPAGYYSSAITIKPILSTNDGANKIINTTTYTASGAVTNATPPSGYDYFTQVTVPAVGTFSIVDKTTAAVSIGAYDDTNKVYPVSVSNLLGKFSTAGWATNSAYTDSSVIVGTLPKAGHSTTQSSSATGSGTPTTINQQYFKDVITAGYLPASTTHYKVKDGGYSYSLHTDNKFGGSTSLTSVVTINKLYLKDAISEGWLPDSTTYYKVLDAEVSAVTASFNESTRKVTFGGGVVGTPGWIASNITLPSAITIAQGTHSRNLYDDAKYGGTNTQTVGATITKQYFTDVIGKGWQAASTTYCKVKDGRISEIIATFDPTTAKVTISGGTVAAGWISGNVALPAAVSIGTSLHRWGSAFAATTANTGLIVGNWYVPCEITAGYTPQKTEYLNLGAGDVTLKDLTGESNIGLAQTTVLENLTSDTTFTAADGKFFHSMKVEIAGVIDKLQAI